MENAVKKLVCFDIDGTLIRNTNAVEYLCKLAGKGKEVAEIEEKENCVELNWIEADYIKAEFMKGIQVRKIIELFDNHVSLIDNIDAVINRLKELNYDVILVTAGPKQVANVFNERYEFNSVYGSEYEEVNGVLTGKILTHLGDHGKLEVVEKYSMANRVSAKDVIAVGDSSSDIEVFKLVGKSIAINYSKSLEGNATEYIVTNDLLDILSVIE